MNNLCIIPARGGSKRIHRKNIKLFLGKPIISYSIEAAINSNLFKEVMVSTDDNEIAGIARGYGAKVPFLRSEKGSNDFAILNDVYEEVLDAYKKIDREFDHVALILPTAPLIDLNELNRAYKLLIDQNFDSIRPVIPFSSPIQRALKLEKNQKVTMIQPEHYRSRSQDLDPAYFDAGQFYWVNKGKTLTDTNKGAIVISEINSQDIDNETDWELAELKYKYLRG